MKLAKASFSLSAKLSDMYKLTSDQIKEVEDYLKTPIEWDESEKIGHTYSQLKVMYKPYFGDAPFEFEDIFISNPLFDTSGGWLGSYEKACDFYGEELVNKYFGKLIETHWKEPVELDSDTFVEAAVDNKISDKPIFKDNKITIYYFNDINKLSELVKDEVDIGSTRGNFLLITESDNYDDKFDIFVENDDIWVVDLESGTCWSNNNIESIDGLRDNRLTAEEWAAVDDALKNENLYASCDLKDKPIDATFSADIPWYDMRNDFREVKSNNRVETIPGSVALDVLQGNYQPNIYYEENFMDDVIDDISEENLTLLANTFNIPRENIKKIINSSTESDLGDNDKCWKLVNDALYNTLYNSEYNNLLEDVYKGIKDCFPGYFLQYVELDSDGFHIKNCPKSILSRLMNDYIEKQEENDWLENIYSETNLIDLIGGLIALNLFIKERYSYQDYDKDEFNDMIETLVGEL